MIPTEPIGSIPRPLALIAAVSASGDGADPKLDPLYDDAIRDTIARLEATGSPVITDGHGHVAEWDSAGVRAGKRFFPPLPSS